MPHSIQTRDLSTEAATIEIHTREDGSRTITGYASVFFREGDRGTEYELWEGFRERIAPSAFDRAISEKHDVRGLVNHDPKLILGRTTAGTLRLTVDQRGLRYEITPPDTTAARDTMESLRRGDITGSSFAFIPTRYEFGEADGYDYVEVRDVDLYDVGPVTFPAYSGATSGLREQRSLELLREQVKSWKQEREEQKLEAEKAKENHRRLLIARARLAEIQ